jgi:hypothetical protein
MLQLGYSGFDSMLICSLSEGISMEPIGFDCVPYCPYTRPSQRCPLVMEWLLHFGRMLHGRITV